MEGPTSHLSTVRLTLPTAWFPGFCSAQLSGKRWLGSAQSIFRAFPTRHIRCPVVATVSSGKPTTGQSEQYRLIVVFIIINRDPGSMEVWQTPLADEFAQTLCHHD